MGQGWERRFRVVFLLFFSLSARFAFAAAESRTPRSPQKPLRHEVSVTLKLIQVFVTDRKGNPVTDLRKEDFVVYDNGRHVDVTEFEIHVLPDARSEGFRAGEMIVPTPAVSPRQVHLLPGKFFLFFDFAYNNLGGIRKAREAALHFLDEKVVPGDEVGLLSISMLKGLIIHEYLSADHQKVRDAVAALDVESALSSGRAEDIEDEYWRRMAEETPPDKRSQFGRKSIYELNADRQEARNQALVIVQQIISLARALRNVPGQKHFIFFSTGVPGSMIHGYQSGYAQVTSVIRTSDGLIRGPDFGDPVLRTANEEMYRELAASGCSFFSFDTREAALTLPGASLFAYEAETFGTGYRDVFSEAGASKPPVELFKDDKLTGRYTIGRLSKLTGGEYFSNINEFEKNLDKVQVLAENYYVLGYRLADERDGKFHDLKVKVLRKGCEVRAQSGYFNPKAFRECSDLEKNLQLVELALTGKSPYETPLPIPIVPLSYVSGGETRLGVLARITPEAIEKFLGGRVEVVTLMFDDKEDLAGLQRIEADLSGYEGMDVFAAAEISLGPGRYDCRVVVRDLETGTAAVAAGRVEIEERMSAGLKAESPLLLLPGGALAYFEDVSGKEGGRAGSWSDVYAFDRARFAPIVGDGIPAGTMRLAAVVPCSVGGILAPRIVLEAKLVDPASGMMIPLPITSARMTRKGDLEIFFLEMSLAGVPPGNYDFAVRAEETGSGLTSEAKAGIVLRSFVTTPKRLIHVIPGK
jgi:VWFA-related protein